MVFTLVWLLWLRSTSYCLIFWVQMRTSSLHVISMMTKGYCSYRHYLWWTQRIGASQKLPNIFFRLNFTKSHNVMEFSISLFAPLSIDQCCCNSVTICQTLVLLVNSNFHQCGIYVNKKGISNFELISTLTTFDKKRLRGFYYVVWITSLSFRYIFF